MFESNYTRTPVVMGAATPTTGTHQTKHGRAMSCIYIVDENFYNVKLALRENGGIMSYASIYFTRTNGKSEIEKLVDTITAKYGGINDCDMDDFYSLAGWTFISAEASYDPSKGITFRSYLRACISNKVKEMLTARNAYKRTAQREAVSIDTPTMSDANATIADIIPDPYADVEEVVFAGELSEKTERYLKALTRKQRRMANLIMEGAEQADIMREMNIDYVEYNRILDSMRSYELASILN